MQFTRNKIALENIYIYIHQLVTKRKGGAL
jgi:hypothetical protein